jgi:putative ATPase
MNLFDQHRQAAIAAEAPLAARMRPRTLDEFVGQDAIIGQGRLLRRAIQADQLSSVIFYGPPGTGKTTLAQIIANTTRAHFIAINAVLAGVKEIRDAIATAQDKRGMFNQRTILFVDEVHRFNKAQQDALLPWVENGTILLIGATTENPYFEVNKALVSRSRVFQLKALDESDLRRVVHQALTDGDRGYGQRQIHLDEDAVDHLVNVANGDARTLLNALELAVETTPADAEGVIQITRSVAEESIQQRAVLYDKEGDVHFDTISAFIKSLRGSDPDAALYWLARMIYAGEDPRFIFRRMVILAGEDVGMADPNAVVVVNACAQAFERVGMPEGRYPLAQAAIYLATAAKSNSVMGFFDALAAVEREREAEVPNHLRDANRDKHSFGHGQGYLYPHAYRDHWIEQQYLPSSLQGQVFYQPSEQGYEQKIQVEVAQRRETQLAAMMEGIGVALPEVLTFSPADSAQDRWLQRTLSQAGEQLATVRDRLFDQAQVQRHHVILVLNASGLLTWEALRQVPEGGVYACSQSLDDVNALREQSAALPEMIRPIVYHSPLLELPQVLESGEASQLRFDRIIGRNTLMAEPDKLRAIEMIMGLLRPASKVVLAETMPRRAQRLYRLVDGADLTAKLYKQWTKAEESIYQNADDPMVNWDDAELRSLWQVAGYQVDIQVETTQTDLRITSSLLARWFGQGGERPSYGDHLAKTLSEADIKKIQALLQRKLENQVVVWQSAIAFCQVSSP